MIQSLKDFFSIYKQINSSARILIAFSGGKDSTALTYALYNLGYDIIVAHFNHQLRPEAKDDEDFCKNFTEKYNISFVSGTADVGSIAKCNKWNLEETARKLRYEFLQKAANATNCSYIATAHHLDDNIETMLFHFMRGSGIQGLIGIPKMRDNIIRPLINVPSKVIESYCEENNLEYLSDSMNEDLDYSRVRIRKKIVPQLEEIHSNFREAISVTRNILEDENSFLQMCASEAMQQCLVYPNGNLTFLTENTELFLDINKLRSMHPALIKRVLQISADFFHAQLSYMQIIRLCEAIINNTSTSITTDEGALIYEVNAKYVHAYIGSRIREIAPCALKIPDELDSTVLGWKIVTEFSHDTSIPADRRSLEAKIDYSKCTLPFHVRNMKEGEKFTPLGLTGSKLLTDYFNDLKLSPLTRKQIPLICDMMGVIWIPGCGIADRVKITSDTKKCLKMKIIPKHLSGH